MPEVDEEPVWGLAREDFDGSEFGPEYLSFNEGQELGILSKETDGWALGVLKKGTELVQGWFPPDFWSSKGSLAPPRSSGLHQAHQEKKAKNGKGSKGAKGEGAEAEEESTTLADGVVKVFFAERRYGFVDCNGLDVFLHLSDCGQHTPRVGDLVRFMIERRACNPKQMQAKMLVSALSIGLIKPISRSMSSLLTSLRKLFLVAMPGAPSSVLAPRRKLFLLRFVVVLVESLFAVFSLLLCLLVCGLAHSRSFRGR
ncbi:unnamed protein product [Durusdinium trenchii]|uniref:SH3 domain-containing protein n=1 Tax=Durusdinium trenchii TaxID=1381693 RepID=A0ABP0IX48_9DINO